MGAPKLRESQITLRSRSLKPRAEGCPQVCSPTPIPPPKAWGQMQTIQFPLSFFYRRFARFFLSGMTSSEKRQTGGKKMWPWGEGCVLRRLLAPETSFGIGSGKTQLSEGEVWSSVTQGMCQVLRRPGSYRCHLARLVPCPLPPLYPLSEERQAIHSSVPCSLSLLHPLLLHTSHWFLKQAVRSQPGQQ